VASKKKPDHDQKVNPRPDFDFEDEVTPDNSVPPVGRPAAEEGE
jgi:hypothetical protein